MQFTFDSESGAISFESISFHRITSNWFLTVATFLDPRFHRITSSDERERIQTEFSKNVKDAGVTRASMKVESDVIAAVKSETHKRNSKLWLDWIRG